ADCYSRRRLAPDGLDPARHAEDDDREPDDRGDRAPHRTAEDQHRAESDDERRERVGGNARVRVHSGFHANNVHRYTSEKITTHTASTKCQYTLTASRPPRPRRAKSGRRVSSVTAPIATSPTSPCLPCRPVRVKKPEPNSDADGVSRS